MDDPKNRLDFDGEDTYTNVQVEYAEDLNPQTFSFEAWAMVTGGDGDYRAVVYSRDNDNKTGYNCYAGSNNQWQFWIGGDGYNPTSGDTGRFWVPCFGPTVVNDTWTYLAGTYDGSTMTLYVNGQAYSVEEQYEDAQQGFEPNTTNPLIIGGPSSVRFPGRIANVRIWNRALSAQEILQNYNQVLKDWYAFDPRQVSDNYRETLVGWWPLNEGTGTTAMDHARCNGTPHNGTINNGTWGYPDSDQPTVLIQVTHNPFYNSKRPFRLPTRSAWIPVKRSESPSVSLSPSMPGALQPQNLERAIR